jgi:hypothetical protein
LATRQSSPFLIATSQPRPSAYRWLQARHLSWGCCHPVFPPEYCHSSKDPRSSAPACLRSSPSWRHAGASWQCFTTRAHPCPSKVHTGHLFVLSDEPESFTRRISWAALHPKVVGVEAVQSEGTVYVLVYDVVNTIVGGPVPTMLLQERMLTCPFIVCVAAPGLHSHKLNTPAVAHTQRTRCMSYCWQVASAVHCLFSSNTFLLTSTSFRYNR